MSRPRAKPRILALALEVTLVAMAVAAPACRRGGEVTPTRPRQVQPYPGYFQARVGDDIYLFATLVEKTAFHNASVTELPFELFRSRTGQRIFISSADPALVPRIEVAYEQALGTELAAFDPIPRPAVQPGTSPAEPQSAPTTRSVDEAGAGGD